MTNFRASGEPQPSSNGYTLANRYQMIRQIAKQRRRVTYLARDLATQDVVVLKLLSFNREFQLNEMALCEQEAKVLQAIEHPSVPRYLNHFEVELRQAKGFALVQSYVAGRSLQEFLEAGRVFTEEEAKQIAETLLNVLVYLHGLTPPIIHRDIKPANILLVESPETHQVGKAYLIDFGAVEVFATGEDSSTSTTMGTYGYMPPEQFGGRAIAASDLYSLGVTLISLVTGAHPSKLPRKNLRIQFEPLVQLSPGFADWLKWMTEPGLEHRLGSAKEALATLHQQQPRGLKPQVVFRRPSGSRVAFNKTASTLEIMIPPVGFKPTVAYVGIAAGIILLLALGLLVLALNSSLGVGLLTTLLSLPLWAIGTGLGAVLVFTLYGRVRLRVNQQQIALIYELFRWKLQYPQPAPIKNIGKLMYVGLVEGNRAKVHPHIVIAAKKYRYKLGSNFLFNLVSFLRITSDPAGFDTLTAAELDWLANELSSWLGLPIARE